MQVEGIVKKVATRASYVVEKKVIIAKATPKTINTVKRCNLNVCLGPNLYGVFARGTTASRAIT